MLVLKSYSRVQARRSPRVLESAQKPLLHSRPGAVEDVAGLITACIEELTSSGYHETAAMLAIARVDLLARRFGITEDELQYMMTATSSARLK